MEMISKHLEGSKITKANLYALADHLMKTIKEIPKINKSCSKKELIDWFNKNWKSISQTLKTIESTEPNDFKLNETEEDSFFIDSESDFYNS